MAEENRPAVTPENLEGKFPSPVLVDFPTIDAAPYNLINPRKFARRFSKFNRKEILKNYELASQIAMKELDTELAGLSKYAPAAAALKRQETAADNLFNQEQRTSQYDTALPGAREQMQRQGARAEELAKGEIPDFLSDAEDRALELGMRSASADRSTAGGFGARSSVARKASDLMSAETRYQMGVGEYQLSMQQRQFGENLLGSNIQTRAALELAPTEYAAAGSEIRAVPEVGAGRLTAGALSEVNQLTMLPTQNAYQMKVQQEQFATNLEQQTRMFNATGTFNASLANQGAQNQFALDKFGYQVGYAGVEAGVETANNNTEMGIAQQQQAGQIFQDYGNQAQQAGQIGAISQGIGAVAPSIINGISGLFNPSGTTADTSSPTSAPAFNADSGNIDFGLEGPSISGEPIEAPTGSPELEVGGDVPPFDYSGYTPDAGSGGGSDLTDPSFFRTASVSGNQFQQATGVPFQATYQKDSDATLRMAGITRDPSAIPGSVRMGANYQGDTLYSNPALLQGTDSTAGMQFGTTATGLLMPLGAFSGDDVDKLNHVSQVAGDPAMMASLDEAAARGDTSSFVNQTLGAFDQGSLSDLVYRPNKNAAATAYTAYQAMQNWPQMSPQQKSIVMAGFGLKATELRGGKTLGEVVIPNTEKPGASPVTIAKAADWFRQGINAYPLTKKWGTFTNLAKVAAGRSDPDTVAKVSSQFKLLGAGTEGAEVPGVTAESLQKDGWSTVPHMGVGAVTGTRNSTIPKGYVKVAESGNRVVAAPAGTAYSAQGAVTRVMAPQQNSAQAMNPNAATAHNILNWGMGAFNIYQMWQGRPGVGAALGTTGTVAQALDRYNQQQSQTTGDPSKITNYSQIAGAMTQAYGAYQAAQNGNYVGAAGFGSAAAFNGMASWARANGDKALAAQYSQYAGYAQAGLNFYQAYQSYQQGDKVGAGVMAAGGAAELAGYGGAGLIAGGALQTYRGWGSGNVANGAVGGSMMMAGTAMLVGGPAGWAIGGGLLAVSVLGNAIKTGTTNKEHIARNELRGYLKEQANFVDPDSNVVLADGTTFSLGQENDEGRHSVAHPEMLSAEQKAGGEDDRSSGESLRAYDCDYTNDLDYVSTMSGTTLMRMLAGGSDTSIDQLGCSLGNAGIANIGYGQAMTRENFDKMMANHRGFYAKAGIGSKTDAYQLANAAFAEGRLDEMGHTQAIQSINMMFDENGFDTAQQLMGGRWKGIEVAQQNAAEEAKSPQPRQPANIPADSEIGQTVGAAAVGMPGYETGTIPGRPGRPIGAAPIQGMKPIMPEGATNPIPGLDIPSDSVIPADWQGWGEMVPYGDTAVGAQAAGAGASFLRSNSTMRMSKDEVRARNAARYQAEAA